MSEIGGATELQLLQADVAIAKKQVEGMEKAETTKGPCEKIAAAIQKAESKDGFMVKEGAVAEQNQYHTVAAPSAQDGCCVVL